VKLAETIAIEQMKADAGFINTTVPVGMEHKPRMHPPSLKNPQTTPTGNPGEKDDRLKDVTRRKNLLTLRKRLARNQSRPAMSETAIAPVPGQQ